MTQIVEAKYRDTIAFTAECSEDLTAKEILDRYGLSESRYAVSIWPKGQPYRARTVKEES